MRIEAKGKKSVKKNKLYLFPYSGNRPLRRASERSRPVYLFFFLSFASNFLTLRMDANLGEGKEKRKKNKLHPFRSLECRLLRRTSERSRPVYLFIFFFLFTR